MESYCQYLIRIHGIQLCKADLGLVFADSCWEPRKVSHVSPWRARALQVDHISSFPGSVTGIQMRMLGCAILQIPMSLIAMLAVWICARLRRTTTGHFSSYFLLLLLELDLPGPFLLYPLLCLSAGSQKVSQVRTSQERDKCG